LGQRIAKQCLAQGGGVSALARREAHAETLRNAGLEVQMADLDKPLSSLEGVPSSHIYYLAPPPSTGVRDTRVEHFLAALSEHQLPAKLVYLSTTGVYGDCQGAWVDETQEVHPVVDRAHRRWSAEQQFQTWGREQGVPVVILRVAGIYGPDRLPLARLKRGEPMVGETESPYTNRIYIEDLVNVCRAAMERGKAGEVYNVSDGHPGNMAGYFNQVADFAGLARPPQISLQEAQQTLSPGMLSYLGESRRLVNQKMLEQLELTLAFPTLELGLRDIAEKQAP